MCAQGYGVSPLLASAPLPAARPRCSSLQPHDTSLAEQQPPLKPCQKGFVPEPPSEAGMGGTVHAYFTAVTLSKPGS